MSSPEDASESCQKLRLLRPQSSARLLILVGLLETHKDALLGCRPTELHRNVMHDQIYKAPPTGGKF